MTSHTSPESPTWSIPRRDWLLALLVSLALSMLITLPYLLGFALAKPGTFYTGLVMNPEDSQSYFAKMLQGFDGNWLYHIPFTPEPHRPAFVGGFYLFLGHLARLWGVSIDIFWQFSRFVSSLILFLATFFFVSVFSVDSWNRWTAYFLALFGSGLGWLLFLLNQANWLGAFPVDFKMPEAHIFFTALTFPHVAMGTTLLMAIILLYRQLSLRGEHSGRARGWLSLLSGLVNLALGIIYPFILLLVALIVFFYWFTITFKAKRVRWRMSGYFALPFVFPLPLYLYYLNTFISNDVFRVWTEQAATLSPPWPHYLVAYGPMLFLALLTFSNSGIKKEAKPGRSLLWCWILAAGVLLFAPLNFQRRFVQGVHVPLAILATEGLVLVIFPALESSHWYQRLLARPRYSATGMRRLIIVGFILFMALSNIYLLADVALTAAFRQPYPFFRSTAELSAVQWLVGNTDRSDVVLTAYQTGNFLAAHAGNPVTTGHWAETVHREQKDEEIGRFFALDTDPDWRHQLLDRYNVRYVWYGKREQSLGGFSPEESDYLDAVYRNSEIVIYSVSR